MDTQLAVMATEGQGVKGKEEDSANVSHIEDRKKVPGKKTSQLTWPGTDVAEPVTLVQT